MATLMALATEAPLPIRQLNPEVPPALVELVMWMMAKNPGDRPRACEVILNSVENLERNWMPAQQGMQSHYRESRQDMSNAAISSFGSIPAQTLGSFDEVVGKGKGTVIPLLYTLGAIVLVLVFFVFALSSGSDDGSEPPDTKTHPTRR